MIMKYDWDPMKAEINLVNHKVDFVLAKTVFDDPLHVVLYDRYDPVRDEHRYNALGFTSNGVFLIVSHVYKGKNGNRTWIISARKGDKYEEKLFREERFK